MDDNNQRLIEFQKYNTGYIGDYIKFTDQKAGIALTVCLALLGFYGLQIKKTGLNNMNMWDFGVLLGIICMILSAYFLIWRVIWPRYQKDPTNYFSWGGISSFGTGNDYATRVGQTMPGDFALDFAKQNYELAKVCAKKYDNLRWAFVYLSAGAVLSTFCWFFGL